MNRIFGRILSTVLAIGIAAPLSADVHAEKPGNGVNAVNAAAPAGAVEIKSENVTLEYAQIDFSGSEQKPAVRVAVGGTPLEAGTDFIAEFPKDCVNAGEKKVVVKGTGKYSGSVSVTYKINAADCSEGKADVSVEVAPCVYDGTPQTPRVTVKLGGHVLTENADYTLEYANNINASSAADKASCTISFTGNYKGGRKIFFDIAKAFSYDFEIELKSNPGKETVFDLSALKPDGAFFGTPVFYPIDFASNKPKIAFNELRFTLDTKISSPAYIEIPVKNVMNYEDYFLSFVVIPTNNTIPLLNVKPIVKEFDGMPVTAGMLAESGSFAEVNGGRIEGDWSFREDPPCEPCEKRAFEVIFKPRDERYETVSGVAAVTVSKIKPVDFAITPGSSELGFGQTARLYVSGLPDKYTGEVTVTCDSDDPWLTITRVSDARFDVTFPALDALYTFTAEFGGDEHHAPAKAQCTVKIGDPRVPDSKDPVTTAEELSAMISAAKNGDTVKAAGCSDIPAALVKQAADKKLIFEINMTESLSWTIDAAKSDVTRDLDLKITSASVPPVLLDKLGGEKGESFNIASDELGSAAKLGVKTSARSVGGKQFFASLFLYNTEGELEFVSCAKTDSSGAAALAVSGAGKYAVITDTETKMTGDLDNSCTITARDASTLLKMIASAPSALTVEEYPKANFNGDGRITAADASAILKYIVTRAYSNSTLD